MEPETIRIIMFEYFSLKPILFLILSNGSFHLRKKHNPSFHKYNFAFLTFGQKSRWKPNTVKCLCHVLTLPSPVILGGGGGNVPNTTRQR